MPELNRLRLSPELNRCSDWKQFPCIHGGNTANIRERVITPSSDPHKEMGSSGKSEVGARVLKEPGEVIRDEHQKTSKGPEPEWLTPGTPVFGRRSFLQEDCHKFQAKVDYQVRPRLKTRLAVKIIMTSWQKASIPEGVGATEESQGRL